MGQKTDSFKESCSSNFESFQKFLYNPEQGTVLGRTGSGWGRIGLFYLFYYAFLAGLFAISITLTLQSLDEYKPFFQTRLQSPGVMVKPTPDPIISFKMSKPASYQGYVEQMKEFLLYYSDENQTDTEIFRDCNPEYIQGNQKFDYGDVAKSCRFPINELGSCRTYPYGYDTGKPCVLVKVNRIIDWTPVAFNSLDDENAMVEGSESKAPPLKEVLLANGIDYNPYRMYVSCYGMKEEDQINLNQERGVSTYTRYYPKDNGMPFSFYPYLGRKRQPMYHSPLVAVQFNNVTKGTEIKVGCKVYAANIGDLMRTNTGFIDFSLKIDE